MDGWLGVTSPSHSRATILRSFGSVFPARFTRSSSIPHFFRGNFPESCSIDGAVIPGYPMPEELLSDEIVWTEILSRQTLQGDSKNRFKVASRARYHPCSTPHLSRWRRGASSHSR